MSEISRFLGIVIRMYFDEHNPPHFHAEYAEFEAVVSIATLSIIHGKLPPRVRGLVIEWATLHQTELQKNWDRMRADTQPVRIEPLQ
jgi:hypothetical protein